MVSYCVEEFKKKHKVDMFENPKALRGAKTACEKAKKALSFSTDIKIDSWHEGEDFHTNFTRDKFEALNVKIFNKCMDPVKKCLEDAEMDIRNVDDVVLVGGSSRIPKVQHLLKEVFKGKELCKSINPEEAVAYGAAVQAAGLSGNVCGKLQDFTLSDVIPMSLGIQIIDGRMNVVIPRNTKIPTKVRKPFETSIHYQTAISFRVFEGENEFTKDNNYLGGFTIDGLPRARNGAQLEVSFSIDENGLLNVASEVLSTRQKKDTTINRGRSTL